MAAKLAVHYDRQADILYLTTRPSYPEQETEELGDDIVARLNPETGNVESLEILFFSKRVHSDSMECRSRRISIVRAKAQRDHLLSAELRPSAASRADSLGLLRTRQSAARRLQRLVRQSPFAAYRSCRVKDPAERFVDGFG